MRIAIMSNTTFLILRVATTLTNVGETPNGCSGWLAKKLPLVPEIPAYFCQESLSLKEVCACLMLNQEVLYFFFKLMFQEL